MGDRLPYADFIQLPTDQETLSWCSKNQLHYAKEETNGELQTSLADEPLRFAIISRR